MFESNLANFYSVGAVLCGCALIYVVISKWRQPSYASGLLSTSQENVTGLAAIALSTCSVMLSISFAITLAFNIFLVIPLTLLFGGAAILEFTSSFHLAKAWRERSLGKIIASLLILIGSFSISVLAGNSLLNIAENEAKNERIRQGAEYNQFTARREAANRTADELRIDKGSYDAAVAAVPLLIAGKEQAQKSLDACIPTWITKCVNPRTKLLNQATLKVANNQQIIDNWSKFKAAEAHADKLNSTKITAIPNIETASPGIVALATILKQPADLVGAVIFLYLSIFTEFGAIVAFYLWSESRLERSQIQESGGRVFDQYTQSEQSYTQGVPEPTKTAHEPVTDTTRSKRKSDASEAYKLLVQDINSGTVNNLSFIALRKWSKENALSLNQQDIAGLRAYLVRDKIAVADSTKKLILTNQGGA